jgi:hypothetical protein
VRRSVAEEPQNRNYLPRTTSSELPREGIRTQNPEINVSVPELGKLATVPALPLHYLYLFLG